MWILYVYIYILYIYYIYFIYVVLYPWFYLVLGQSLGFFTHNLWRIGLFFLNLPKRRWQSKIYLPILTFEWFLQRCTSAWHSLESVGSYSIDCWAPCFHCCSSWTSHCQWLVNSISDDFIFVGFPQAFLAVRVIIPFIRSRMTDDPDCWVNTILISIPLKYSS